jgi:hypothetical protein
MGPRAGLDAVAKTEIPCPCRELNPGRPACSVVIMLLLDCARRNHSLFVPLLDCSLKTRIRTVIHIKWTHT